MHFDGGDFPPAAIAHGASGTWVEVTSPITEVLGVLAKAIQETPGALAGASIAVTRNETILLNERAWVLFSAALSTVAELTTRTTDPGAGTKPLRFLLISGADETI